MNDVACKLMARSGLIWLFLLWCGVAQAAPDAAIGPVLSAATQVSAEEGSAQSSSEPATQPGVGQEDSASALSAGLSSEQGVDREQDVDRAQASDLARALEPVTVATVIQSEHDAREYRHLLLANGLQVLLISDPAAEKSAAALDVNIGHNQNPPTRPGLAHFLEHMLFLGTKKYPQAGEYYQFINQHGGYHNAYTTAEHTNYFFEIDNAQFEPALDRFAQFFIAPLFDPLYVERERHAVHSEYRARYKDDVRRALDVYRELMNPKHPAAGFGVGTLDTLADTEEESLRDALIDFYTHFYSADVMSLVVLGRESLDELQRMTVARFAAVATRKSALPDTYPALFADNFLPAEVQIKPEKEIRQLRFLFPIPGVSNEYHTKPFDYIAHMLGHEGEGSLFALLKQLGWAERLSAGIGLENRHDGFFHITIDLTEIGVRARSQIPTLIFYMIGQLEQRGVKDWRYEELHKMAQINFRFQEKLPPVETVRKLAKALHDYQPADVLRGEFLFARYDEKLIKQSLSYLREDNLLLVLTAPEVTTTQESFYYQTPYDFAPLTRGDFEVKPTIRRRLFFPEPNVFIPTRLAIKSKPLLPAPGNPADSPLEVPQLVVQSNRVQAWFLQDQHFNVPKTHINLRLKLPVVARDARGAAQAHLFAALVRDQLNELTYPATLAGLHHGITATARGLDIEIAGYSDRQGLLLNRIADSIRKGRFSEDRFNVLKADLMRAWRNQNQNLPYQVMMQQIPVLHFEPYWSEQILSESLAPITFSEFQRFSNSVLRDGHLDALFYGNVYRQEALRLVVMAEHQLLGVSTGQPAPPTRVYHFADSTKPWLYRHTLNHDDYIALLYVQGLADTLGDAAHMQLLRHILQPLFFDELRTQKQLGYVVAVMPLALRSLEGNIFIVQSPAVEEAVLIAEVERFLQDQKDHLADHLEEHQQALVRRLEQPARSLAEQAERWWESILLADYAWDRREQLATAVAAITPESLTEFYTHVMLDPTRRLWLSSARMNGGEDYSTVEKVEDYRSQQRALIYR